MPTATIDDVRRARRILLHGVAGSGKSTAALALGARLGLPAHLSDDEFGWLPGWVQRSADEMRALAGAVALVARQAALIGPAPVAVHHHGHMPRHELGRDRRSHGTGRVGRGRCEAPHRGPLDGDQSRSTSCSDFTACSRWNWT